MSSIFVNDEKRTSVEMDLLERLVIDSKNDLIDQLTQHLERSLRPLFAQDSEFGLVSKDFLKLGEINEILESPDLSFHKAGVHQPNTEMGIGLLAAHSQCHDWSTGFDYLRKGLNSFFLSQGLQHVNSLELERFDKKTIFQGMSIFDIVLLLSYQGKLPNGSNWNFSIAFDYSIFNQLFPRNSERILSSGDGEKTEFKRADEVFLEVLLGTAWLSPAALDELRLNSLIRLDHFASDSLVGLVDGKEALRVDPFVIDDFLGVKVVQKQEPVHLRKRGGVLVKAIFGTQFLRRTELEALTPGAMIQLRDQAHTHFYISIDGERRFRGEICLIHNDLGIRVTSVVPERKCAA